jgi:hypothetical protein
MIIYPWSAAERAFKGRPLNRGSIYNFIFLQLPLKGNPLNSYPWNTR